MRWRSRHAIRIAILSATLVMTSGLLPGTMVVLQNDGGDKLPISAAGSPYVMSNVGGPVAIIPRGAYLYTLTVNSRGTSVLAGYAIDPATGALTSIPQVMAAGISCSAPGLVIDPSGKFIYCTDAGAGSGIDAAVIDPATGDLTPVPGSPYAFQGLGQGSLAIATVVP